VSVATFRVPTRYGDLVGDVTGQGPELLLLHGGPGLSDYLAPLAEELTDGYTVARYTQRGLAPSSEEGPVGVTEHVDDVMTVVDHLGWQRPFLGGHSWGGHLVMHVLARSPDRFAGGLVIDPLGAVGDGAMAAFAAELDARVPEDSRARLAELDAQEQAAGSLPPDLALEQFTLYWPAYFADPTTPAPMPRMALAARRAETWSSMLAELPGLQDGLRDCVVPTVFVHGAASPMPVMASTESAALMAEATVEIVDDSGHFPWLDKPGSVRAALDRLAQRLV
jgi:proline iminopeptidase